MYMKEQKRIVALLICTILCFGVIGCSGKRDPLVGTWSVESASVGTENTTQLNKEELLKQLGVETMDLVFKDGKVDMKFGETESEGTYTLENGKLVIEDTESKSKLEGTLSGDDLTVQRGETKIIFKKK